jgi:hypothetical protein
MRSWNNIRIVLKKYNLEKFSLLNFFKDRKYQTMRKRREENRFKKSNFIGFLFLFNSYYCYLLKA